MKEMLIRFGRGILSSHVLSEDFSIDIKGVGGVIKGSAVLFVSEAGQ